VSRRFVFALRCSRDSATLVEWMTKGSILRARTRANQNPIRTIPTLPLYFVAEHCGDLSRLRGERLVSKVHFLMFAIFQGFVDMRCLIVADLHYSLPQFDWLLSAAPQFDLVIFAGDALDVGSSVDFRAQIIVVKKYLSLLSGITRVILCSGNHDLDERNPEGEKISRWIGEVRKFGVACDGDSVTIDDTLFTVCPWWDGPLLKQRIDNQLREAAAERSKRWIWVHHAPPANSPTSWGGKRFFGDVELAQWIQSYQPSMVISGHVHQSRSSPTAHGSIRLAKPGFSMRDCSLAVRPCTSWSMLIAPALSGYRQARSSPLI
jgi:Icc-related predicted phosphoesterase